MLRKIDFSFSSTVSTIISIFVAMKLTFGRQEKLKSKKAIEQLFIEGDSVSSYPLRLIYLKKNHPSNSLLQVSVSVSKRKTPKAVHRNRIKRLLREAYRLNKYEFLKGLDGQYIGMFLYLDSKEWEQEKLKLKMKKLASKFIEKTKQQ